MAGPSDSTPPGDGTLEGSAPVEPSEAAAEAGRAAPASGPVEAGAPVELAAPAGPPDVGPAPLFVETPAPVPGDPRRKYRVLMLVFSLVLFADQATKYLAVAHLTNLFATHHLETPRAKLVGFYRLKNLDNDPFEKDKQDQRKPPKRVVERYWNHKYVENPGAAWGLLANIDDRWRVPFFHFVSIAAILFIAVFFRRLEPDQRLLAFALSLVLGGAVGNYVDRLARNYVIDFIDWHWRDQPNMHWPTFNVADAAICVGVALMLLETLFTRRHEDVRAVALEAPAAEPSPDISALRPATALPTPEAVELPGDAPSDPATPPADGTNEGGERV